MVIFEELNERHKCDVMNILNYYVENSYAAYSEEKMADTFFENIVNMTTGYPAYVVKIDENIVGFAFLRAYNPFSTFSETAEITYFIDKDHTGRGIGKMILDKIEKEAKAKGIYRILASISSRNTHSIKFHEKNNFVRCGQFPGIGRKFANPFDVIWMIKKLV